MVSKEVSMDIRKFKSNATGKRSKSKEAEPVKPPQEPRRDKSVDETVYVNNMRKYLKELDVGTADQLTLLKLLVIKSDEADLSF